MIFQNNTFKCFSKSNYLISRLIFAFLLFFFIAFVTSAFSALNFPLFLLLYSSYYILSYLIVFILAIRSDDLRYLEKWSNDSSRRLLMKEKVQFTLFFSFFLLILIIMLFFFIEILPLKRTLIQFKYTVDWQNLLFIYMIIFSYFLISKSLIYWLADSFEIKSYSVEIKALKTEIRVYSKIISLASYCFLTFAINLIISHYYIDGSFFTSSEEISLVLILELVIIYIINHFFFLKSKKNFEKNGYPFMT